jgi:hypothetical protein
MYLKCSAMLLSLIFLFMRKDRLVVSCLYIHLCVCVCVCLSVCPLTDTLFNQLMNVHNIVMYWRVLFRWIFISTPKLNTLQLNSISNSPNTRAHLFPVISHTNSHSCDQKLSKHTCASTLSDLSTRTHILAISQHELTPQTNRTMS